MTTNCGDRPEVDITDLLRLAADVEPQDRDPVASVLVRSHHSQHRLKGLGPAHGPRRRIQRTLLWSAAGLAAAAAVVGVIVASPGLSSHSRDSFVVRPAPAPGISQEPSPETFTPTTAPTTASTPRPGAAPFPNSRTSTWPDPALTILTIPEGSPPAITADDQQMARSIAQSTGQDYNRLLELIRYQDSFSALVEQVEADYPQQYSASSGATYDGQPAWIAMTGTVPEQLIQAAQRLAQPVQLRGGAALSAADALTVQAAALETFDDLVQPADDRAGEFDATTAHLRVGYLPGPTGLRADSETAQRMQQAVNAQLGRSVPLTITFVPGGAGQSTSAP
ncbi:hypothetical protein SAMN06264364_11921 [Quadrisphaera granulorum]|uniref:Uncharacterized protein n=1 Tax=Quadrisphaera granulorum TaxID=317664 RepID=A0A316A4Q5_9ACTN|nr:hypothetical protein [Quadrisphaera granulorum]PWJ52529.1 hypothetical protein BXY45_11921 [Quadrisphaera granulorum]SZE97579.1 hypothetical protein SAMN06264364_11921 [Quadrisphaera granulorum]